MSRAPHTVREFMKAIEARGYTVEKRPRGKHPYICRPNGTFMMPMPSSPSEYRSLRNTWAQFERKVQETSRLAS